MLAGGALAVSAMLIWRPWPERNDLSYAGLASVRDSAWIGSVIDGLGLAAAAVALGLAACLLAPVRGAAWANVGAVVTGFGGLAFGAGTVSFAVLGWYATATEAIPADVGATLLGYVEDDFGRIGILVMGGFLLFTVGSLLLMVALWRARAVPRWLPIAFTLLTVALFAGLPGRVLDVVQAVQVASLTLVAWYLWRATAPAVERTAA